MKLVVAWKNQKPFKLEIDGTKTILQLKEEIAKHFNEKYTGFNILSGTDIIDSSSNNKTLDECGLKRLIRLPDNYEPGVLHLIRNE
jgi:hypothetical protein